MAETPYLNGLARCYSELSQQAVAETAAAAIMGARRLQEILPKEAASKIAEAATALQGSATAGSIEIAVASMKKIAQGAVDEEQKAAEHYKNAVARYDLNQAAFRRFADQPSWRKDDFPAQIKDHTRGIRIRLEQLVDRLIDQRFDMVIFRQILADEVLEQDALKAKLQSIANAQTRRLEDGWSQVALEHEVTWPESEIPFNIDIDAAIEVFFQPIELFYERPGGIRGVFRGLGRGKIREKLIEEVDVGVSNLAQKLDTLLDDAWQKLAESYRQKALEALRASLHGATGNDREGCLQAAEAAEERIEALQVILFDLNGLNVTTWFASRYKSMRHMALAQMASRLQSEHKQRMSR